MFKKLLVPLDFSASSEAGRRRPGAVPGAHAACSGAQLSTATSSPGRLGAVAVLARPMGGAPLTKSCAR
jgi:hypothetical protein